MSLFVIRADKVAARNVGGEMVILSATDSSLFVLNEIGTLVWEAADGRTSIEAIAETVCGQYEVAPETVLRDIEEFVQALTAAGVISTSDHPLS